MSWFQDDAVVLDERPHETVAEGVTLRRRGLLRLSAATVAAGLAAACSSPLRRGAARAAAPTEGALDVTAFLDEMMPRAKGRVELAWMAAVAARRAAGYSWAWQRVGSPAMGAESS